MVSLFQDLFGLKMSLGVVPAMEKRMTQALEERVHDAKDAVKTADRASTNATGWKQNGQRQYLFISVTPEVVTWTSPTSITLTW